MLVRQLSIGFKQLEDTHSEVFMLDSLLR